MLKVISLFLPLFVLACESRDSPKSEPASPAKVLAEVDPSPKDVPETTEEPVEQIKEADLEALLNQWLDAQNKGDFQSYSSLYDEQFNGIKRAGSKTSTFSKDGWLKDRERMFTKKMEVSATDEEFSIAGRSAGIRFTQSWASGTFKDVGPKRLSIIHTEHGLKIAREEMLASTLVGQDVTIPPYNPSVIALLINKNQVVLSLDGDSVKAGDVVLKSVDGVAEAAVKDGGELKHYVGAEVQVHMGEEPPCVAKVKSLGVVARITPHFGQIQAWKGEDGPASSDSKIARDIWSLAQGARVVVGNLDKSCEGYFAIVPAPDRESGLLEFDLSPELKSQALKAYRSLPGHKQLQRDYDSSRTDKMPWDDEVLMIKALGGHSGEVEYIAVSSNAVGCGDFGGAFWAIFQVSPSGGLVLMTDPKDPGETFLPSSAAFVDGDVLFVSSDVVVRKIGAVWRRSHEARIPYYDCPC